MGPLTRSAAKRLREEENFKLHKDTDLSVKRLRGEKDCERLEDSNELSTPVPETALSENHNESLNTKLTTLPENHNESLNTKLKTFKNIESHYGVRGLKNLGASCYINSVIQALMHTPPLRKYFLSHYRECAQNAIECHLCTLLKIFKEYYSGNAMPPMSLHRLLFMIWKEAPYLAEGGQQDANEFYMIYLQILRSSCDQYHSDECFYKCIIDSLYYGTLESNLTCLQCQKGSPKREAFCDISLELNPHKIEDVYDCLANYTKIEILGESVKIYCPNCQSNQEFAKRLSIVDLPNILNINFKRFVQKGTRPKKLTKHVKFPFELNMKAFTNSTECSDGVQDQFYSLLAVIRHKGTLNSGHYTVYVKLDQDIWLLCNDRNITSVAPNLVLASEAYILIYQRKSYANQFF